MIEQITFINHINETMEWGRNGIFVNSNDLHDYSWNFISNNNRISSFNMGIAKKSIPIMICCNSEEEGIRLKNRLMEVCEKDVLAASHGKLVIGEYYLKCYFTASKKTEYLKNKGYMKATLTITTDFPKWVKESKVSFMRSASSGSQTGKRNFDFNYDFPIDYTSEMTNKKLNNTGFVATNFRMIIYGPVVNPIIHISGHRYQVNCPIEDGEYLTIDSLEKTINLTQNDGTVMNKFNNRNRESYIFEQIPSGENSVTWDGNYGFDLILLEERSEPKWI